MSPQKTFAVRLGELLAEAGGISVYRLAKLTGLPKWTLSRYLHGRGPTLANALLIARAFDKSLSVFDDVLVENTLPASKEDHDE